MLFFLSYFRTACSKICCQSIMHFCYHFIIYARYRTSRKLVKYYGCAPKFKEAELFKKLRTAHSFLYKDSFKNFITFSFLFSSFAHNLMCPRCLFLSDITNKAHNTNNIAYLRWLRHTKWLQWGLDYRGHAGTRPDVSATFHLRVMEKKKRTQSGYFLIIRRIVWLCIWSVCLLQITWRARKYCLLHDTYLRKEHIYSHSWFSRTIILFSAHKYLMGHECRQQF
jgi:hypothetical protein